jgi:hypothetical protein
MTRTTTLAALALLFNLTGCAMGLDAGSDDVSRAASPSIKTGKGGAAGQGGEAGQAGNPSHAGAGGDAGTGQGGSGGSEVCPDKCQGSEACGNNCDEDCDGVVDQNCGGDNCPTSCQPTEKCGNNCDDDCDGKVDEDCEFTCEDTDGHNCNGDAGYGDRCDPTDNENGCSQGKFWAWCNRRNDKYPDIWDNYLKAWVDARCDGTITLEDPNNDGYPTFTCRDSNGRIWECSTPLVLSFAMGAHVQFASTSQQFSLGGGQAREWPTAATPWLAMDRNGNGRIDDGGELFGSATALASGALARNGFEALAELDSNADGLLDARDCGWDTLLAWTDENGDGTSQPSELATVASRGLVSIALETRALAHCDDAGNCERERSSFTWSEGAGEVIDVYLRTR